MTDLDPADYPDPVLCYVLNCPTGNELLLHVDDQPAGYADLCVTHAKSLTTTSNLIRTCECFFCSRARQKFGIDNPSSR